MHTVDVRGPLSASPSAYRPTSGDRRDPGPRPGILSTDTVSEISSTFSSLLATARRGTGSRRSSRRRSYRSRATAEGDGKPLIPTSVLPSMRYAVRRHPGAPPVGRDGTDAVAAVPIGSGARRRELHRRRERARGSRRPAGLRGGRPNHGLEGRAGAQMERRDRRAGRQDRPSHIERPRPRVLGRADGGLQAARSDLREP